MATPTFTAHRTLLLLSFLIGFVAGVVPSHAQTEEVVTFAVVGDYGDGLTDAGNVAALIRNQNPSLVITTGDNNYNNNSSTATWDFVAGNNYHTFIKYPAGSTSSFTPGVTENAFFPAFGNHDWDAGGQTTYFELPGNERYYTFVKGPVQFFCIDSDPREPDGTSSSSTQALWLQTQLAASIAPWKVVYMHHPPFSSCTTHGSTPYMQWPYEQWGADVVFAGHDHVYERIVRDANSDGDSLLYVTTGAGGHLLYNFGTPVQGSQVRYNANYGSVIAEATGTSLTVRFYSIAGGGTLIDQYTLHRATTLTPGDVVIAGFQAWNTVGTQNPAEFITLFNTTDSVISLENMNLIARVDPDGAGGSGVGIRWQLSAEPVSLVGKSIAPHSFFLIAESGVASPGGVKDVPTNMDLPTGEGGSTERAIGLELVIAGQHMDYVLYGRNTGSDGGYPDGDLPFDGTTYPRPEIIRNTLGTAAFEEGLVSRESTAALYAGYAVNGAYADDAPAGVWTSPHSTSYSSYQARNSLSPAVLPPGPAYTLTVNVTGIGTVTKNPDKPTYLLNEVVQLTATPPVGWTFSSWSGDLNGSTNPASITMDGDKTVTATFTVVPLTGFMEPFEDAAFVIGTKVGVHPDWYDAGNGPTITSAGGVAASKGLSDAANIFTWEAHPFAWSDTTLQKAVFQMDFKTDGSANFDDDRIGWMTTVANVTSSNFFGVQLDPGGSGYNIEAYWQNSTNVDVRTSLANLTGMVANTWYRLRLEAARLGPTDARLDMALTRLDGSGNPTGTAITASVPSTAALGTDAPNTRYFAAASLWPSFKNFTTAPAPADNAYFEALLARNSLTVSTVGNGSVTKSPDKAAYIPNEIVRLTAVPAVGHHFVSWSGDLTGSQNPDSVTMDTDKNVTATFAINQYTITASAGANGSISPSGAVVVTHGASQAFTIAPNVGYHVDSVFVDGGYVGAVTNYTFTNVTAPHTINAKFAINRYTISASAGANGSISPSGAVLVNHGASQAFTITPAGGYHVDSVFVDGGYVGAVTNYTFTNVTAPHTINAKFTINQYTITASAGANGSISPSGVVLVTHGASQTFTIAPNVGYHVDSVFVDGGYVGAVTNYTFTNVTAPHTINAKFAINRYTITASAGANGSISPSGAVLVNHGANQAFTITPGGGYHVDSVFVDGGYVGAGTNYTFTNVTAPHTINAKFAINQYTITASAGANGSISPSGAVIVIHGTSPVFTITAGTGYHVDSVFVDGGYVGAMTSYTFTNVQANHTINAKFAINRYAITVSSGANGLISPRSILVEYGADQTFTITPATGYHVDSVIVDGAMVGAPTSYTFTNVQASHTIHVVFALNIYTITASAGIHGSITPAGAVPVAHGGSQSFTLVPEVGYHVSDVVVDGSSVGAVTSYAFTNVTSSHTIVASFTINGYTITAAAGPNGSINPSGPVALNWGENQSFTITAGAGYHVDSVMVDNVYVGAVTNYTFSNVTANHTILAKFAINFYSITAGAGPNGSISPSGAVPASYGSDHAFTITPAVGYHVDSVFVDGGHVGAVTNYTFTNVTANHTINARFAINRYTITATAGPNGSITPSGAVSVDYGAAQTFTIAPNAGYHVDSVFVDGGYVGAVTSYPFTNVTANHTISAVFEINRYVISATASVHGSITPSGSVIVVHGNNQAFFMTPDPGYRVDSIFVDGGYVGTVTNYTFTNVQANHTINARFVLNAYVITSTAGPHGTITPLGAIGVNHGGSQLFTVTPDPGYHIDSVLVDGLYVGVPATYTFTNVQGTHTIRAVFAINQYVIAATAGPNGSINPGGAVPVNHGATQVFSIVSDTGYHVDNVLVDGVYAGSTTTYAFTNVTSAHSIHAIFILNEYVITASAGPHGSITPSGTVPVGHGAGVVFVMAPDPGYEMKSLMVDGLPVALTPTYQFTNVTGNHSIAVTFRMTPITMNLGVDNGWNLLSVPLEVVDFRKTVLFPTALTDAYAYAGGGYAVRDTLEHGPGYWLKFAGDQVVPVFGSPLTLDTVAVRAGWNLTGSVGQTLSVGGIAALGTVIQSPFYGYSPSGYGAASQISPGHSYWVKVSANGRIVLAAGTSATPAVAVPDKPAGEVFHALVFEDGAGQLRTLFVGARPEGFSPDLYELPPPPPEGAPDIRFGNDASVVVHDAIPDASADHPIRMQGVVYPVTVRGTFPGEGEVEYFLGYTIQGKTREVKLTGSDRVVTIGQEDAGTLTLRVAPVTIPTEYALAQNFPNPFNPGTTIRFSLPGDGRVQLKLYDILGQEVKTLLDQEMSAGERAVTFDASGLASGVYFYRLKAGDFSATRRMVLLR